MTGKNVAQIGGERKNDVNVGHIGDEIIPDHSQIGNTTGSRMSSSVVKKIARPRKSRLKKIIGVRRK
jgi:hypothetical protein